MSNAGGLQSSTSRCLLAMLLALAGSAGCSRFYWSRPATAADQFHLDSQACATASIASDAALRPGVGVEAARYRRCLTDRGYRREQKWDPVPDGWYRGIE